MKSGMKAWSLGCGMLLFLLSGALFAQEVAIDFSDSSSQSDVILRGKAVFEPEKGRVLLRGPGSVFLKIPTGPGVYQARFSLQEPKGFTYHSNYLRFFASDSTPGKDGYALQWTRGGLFSLSPGQQFIQGGRDNPNRFGKGEAVTLTFVVSKEAVTLYREMAEGEPICTFKLSGTSSAGYFGFQNRKANSEVAVYRLAYTPSTQ